MDFGTFSPALVLVTVISLALAPFVAVMVTSFTKIVVVLSLLRNALGLQQVPPNVVINGLAIVLSIYVMYPVLLLTQEAVSAKMAGRPPPPAVQAMLDERARRAPGPPARIDTPAPAVAAQASTRSAGSVPDATGGSRPPAMAGAARMPGVRGDFRSTSSQVTTPAAGVALGASTPGSLGPVRGGFRTTARVVESAPVAGDPMTAGPAPDATPGPIFASPGVPAPAAGAPAGKRMDTAQLLALIDAGKEPLRSFLITHSSDGERAFFLRSARRLLPPERRAGVHVDDFIVVIPAFTVSELTAAFQIGFLIFLPFLVIDLVVSNILLAMGMMMLSPTTVSLPFKLLLFVLVGGWAKLVHGLVLTYGT